jgi:hypothetical protein
MALSNMLREPRREITESLIGIVIAGTVIAADYEFARWFESATSSIDGGCPWPLGMVLGIASCVIIFFVALITHWIGEDACNRLEDHNIHLRPRQRPTP